MSFKAGFCGIIGMPNAGKSSLLNWLVQEKVSIVTDKPQTTRRRILGIKNTDQGQVVLVDAPGMIKSVKGLNAFLEKEIQEVIESSDALLLVLSLDEEKKETLSEILEIARSSKKPFMVVVNKTDIKSLERRKLLLRREFEENHKDLKVFEISTLSAENRDLILDEILKLMPDSKAPLYDSDLLSPMNTRDLVAELIREQCFDLLHQEVPYGMAVMVTKFEEKENITRIMADLLVSKMSFKPMVIGQKGSMIKQIGIQARKEIEKLLDGPVYLDLNVVVKESWTENKRLMKELGYDILKQQ